LRVVSPRYRSGFCTAIARSGVCRKKEFTDFCKKLLAHNCLLASFSVATNDFGIRIFREF
jgi:hypothetical protein